MITLLELEKYFKGIELPTGHLRLNEWTVIMDVPSFIKSHVSFLKKNKGKKKFMPYYERLVELKEILLSPNKKETGGA